MIVEVLHTPDCPNAGRLIEWLRDESGRRCDLKLVSALVGYGEPVPDAFAGSPTVLVDGTNPFGGTPTGSAACALHPPTIDDLRTRLDLPG